MPLALTIWGLGCWFVFPHCSPWVGALATAANIFFMGYCVGRTVEHGRATRAVLAAQMLHVEDLRNMTALFEIATTRPPVNEETH